MRTLLRPDVASGRFRRISAIAALLVVLAVMLASCDSGSSSDSASKGTSKSAGPRVRGAAAERAGAEEAIAAYLSSQGIEYAGDCEDAELPRDKGKWCSKLVLGDDTTDSLTYELGPVGEKAEKTITLQRGGSARLTPGFQVGVGDGGVGQPHELTRQELESDVWITGNLTLDQAAGIGNGLADLPAGASTGQNETGGGTGGAGIPPAPVVTPGAGTAQYPPQGTIDVTNPVVQVAGEVAFRGGGCVPNEALEVVFDGQPIGTISADASGTFAGSLGVPRGTASGAHLMTVRGANCVFNTTITVAGSLAFTGSSSHTGTYVLIGVAAVAVGLILVVGTRRRRQIARDRQAASSAQAP